VNDDWRVSISFDDEGTVHRLTERLRASGLEHDLESSFGARVIVSRDGAELFCYAGTRDQAERVDGLVRSFARESDWNVTTNLARWHPVAEAWEDPDDPLPEGEAGREEEHEELIEREQREAQQTGQPEWEVRIDFPSRADAARFSKRLEEEGLGPVRRWKYVIVGATDEDSAKALAERLWAEAPEGSQVTAEGSWQEAWQDRASNPFAFLGGLGG
jgi:hypothetical protein